MPRRLLRPPLGPARAAGRLSARLALAAAGMAAAITALTVSAAPEARAQEAGGEEPLRVLAFGDSLTKGTGSTHGGGYRLTFLERMRTAGVRVDMVGTKSDGPPGMDAEHSGHQGQGVAKLDEVVLDNVRRQRPDVVLLMIGTNDADEHLVPEAFRIRYTVLLDRLLTGRTRVLAATIPPSRAGRRVQAKLAVNKIIRAEVERRAREGKAVRLVDVFGALDPASDFLDPVHINDAGYAKVGNAFADALLEALAQRPAAAAP